MLAVEMENAALYAFAQARNKAVICFAHVTNQMGQIDGDFEKGEADVTTDALKILVSTARRLSRNHFGGHTSEVHLGDFSRTKKHPASRN